MVASAAVLKAPNAGVDEEDHAGSALQCSCSAVAALQVAMQCTATLPIGSVSLHDYMRRIPCAQGNVSGGKRAAKRETTRDSAAWPLMRLFWQQHETGDPSFGPGGAKKTDDRHRSRSSSSPISSFLANKLEAKDRWHAICSTCSNNPVPSTYLTARQPPTGSRARSGHSF